MASTPQTQRQDPVLATYRKRIDAELDPEFSEKFIRFVIDEVIRHHQQAAQR